MKNRYEIKGDETVIFLRKKDGTILEALIDTADLPKAQEYQGKWSPRLDPSSSCHYVEGAIRLGEKKTSLKLHRFIMDPPPNKQIDHINQNPLDNRRVNLRVVDPFENCQNRGMRIDNTSGYRGVTWDESMKNWRVRVRSKGKTLFTKNFDDVHEAGKVAEEMRMKFMPYLRDIRGEKNA